MSDVNAVADARAGRQADLFARPLRILIVDDNKSFAETLSWVLEGSGNMIAIAHNGPDAVEIAGRFEPDIVFLDIILPVMDGYEVCRQLRANTKNPNIKILAQSGYDDTAAEAVKHGVRFEVHLTKPLDLRQVVAVIGDIRHGRL